MAKHTVKIIKDSASRKVTLTEEINGIGAGDDEYLMCERDNKKIILTRVA